MAAYIAASTHLVAIAERPSPISARDGMLLRLVPKSERLSHQQLKAALLQASGIGVQDAPAFTAVGMEVPAQQLGFLDASNGTDSCSFGYDPVPAHAHSIPCTPLLVGDSDEGHIQPLSLPHGVLENEHADVALQMAVLGMTHGPEVTHKGAGKVIAPKAGAAWLRGYAYLAQGNITQALQVRSCSLYSQLMGMGRAPAYW